jgi:ABC-type uncharacterized transport system auxiliary subunit
VRAALAAVLLSAGALALGGCGSSPQIRYYQFAFRELEATESSETVTSGDVDSTERDLPILSIENLTPDSAYNDDRIVYRTSPYRLDYYYYHRWSAPPGVLIADFLRQGFQRTGKFHAVLSGPNPESDAILRGRLVALEEVDTESGWKVRVSIELQLRDTSSNEILWSAFLTREQPVEQRNPEGLARTFSAVLEDLVVELTPVMVRHCNQARAMRRKQEQSRQQLMQRMGIPGAGGPPTDAGEPDDAEETSTQEDGDAENGR